MAEILSIKKIQVEALNLKVSTCLKCRLHTYRTHAVPGEGALDARVLFVGQSPGRSEDAAGRPFIGRAGRFLGDLLNLTGLGRDEVYLTSCVKCLTPNNRKPRKDEVEACMPYLERQLSIINPEVVVLLGDVALKAVLGGGSVSHLHGETLVISSRKIFCNLPSFGWIEVPKY
ncbi:MAG: uracil-DNA glycosylase [Candidatus Bathyarchaeia archaeon]